LGRTNQPLFDTYFFIDWSANNSPKRGKDSLWISEAFWLNDHLSFSFPQKAINPATRHIATDLLIDRLRVHLEAGRSTLVGLDFSLSFPHCSATSALGHTQTEIMKTLSDRMTDQPNNQNNRFEVAGQLNQAIGLDDQEGPFWGHPPRAAYDHLNAKRPQKAMQGGEVNEYRIVETKMRKAGHRVFSIWQLFGHGSVGGQALTGLPRLWQIRSHPDLKPYSILWPFETGWQLPKIRQPQIVFVEFWPGLISWDAKDHPIRDAAQVISAVRWAARTDEQGLLAEQFDPLLSNDIDPQIAQQEGWIFGFADSASSQTPSKT
jgi:hypothetical protein